MCIVAVESFRGKEKEGLETFSITVRFRGEVGKQIGGEGGSRRPRRYLQPARGAYLREGG